MEAPSRGEVCLEITVLNYRVEAKGRGDDAHQCRESKRETNKKKKTGGG